MLRSRIKIKGDVSKFLKEKIRDKRAYLSYVISDTWRRSVRSSRILSTRGKKRYEGAIKPYKTVAGAFINDPIVRLLEQGWESFDMRPGLLKGRTKRTIPMQLPGKGETTFRTVKNTSQPNSWRHPGYRGAKVTNRVIKKLKLLVGEVFRE